MICDAVVLAAGSSSRLGSPKQLVRIGGKTLLARAVEAALGSGCRHTWVVLGSGGEELEPGLAGLPVRILDNPQWHEGMGSSVRLAAQRIAHRPDPPDAILFLTCDQPGVTSESLDRLLRAASGPPSIVAASYAGTVGVPALFKRAHYPELARLSGARGAKPLLQKHADQVVGVRLPEAEADVDTPDDLGSG